MGNSARGTQKPVKRVGSQLLAQAASRGRPCSGREVTSKRLKHVTKPILHFGS